MKCPSCQADNPSGSQFCGRCATPLPGRSAGPGAPADPLTRTISSGPRDPEPGTTFAGRYRIIEEIGRGGMGRVYKALDTQVNEKVALKLLKPEIAEDAEMIGRFGSEMTLARRVSHRNICRMFDLGEWEGQRFLTMEYVSGQDLKTVIRMTGSLAIGTVLSVGRQIADGLAEAHALGIVHRDLKPQNILIDTGGRVKIMDFGIARSLREKGLTGPGVMIGTPEYMSPEQVEAREVDARSDIYALGVILYEMAAGRVPFEGNTALSVALKQKTEKPKDPRELNPQVPADLAGIILKCLEKDPARRYASAADVRAELERVEQGLPTTERVAAARRTTASRQITVKFTLRKALVPAAAVLVVLLGFAGWRLLTPKKGAPASPGGLPSLAIVNFENISGEPSLDDWRTGLPELLGTDLSQSKLLTVLSGERTFGILRKLGLDAAKRLSSEDLARIAAEGRVEYVLSGGIMKAGPKIILTAHLQKPRTGELVETKKLECAGEEDIPARVDELTRMVKADLKLTPRQISGDEDKAVGLITTSSPEALKFYLEARKRHMAIDYRSAVPLYEKAVAIDPGFAMAYRSLAAINSNLGFLQKSREYARKALDHADRISARERMLVQGRLYQSSESTFPQAIRTFEELIRLYPDDNFGYNGLSNIYMNIEEYEKALPYLERAYALGGDALNCSNLAISQALLGRYGRAREIWEEFLRTSGENPRAHIELGYLAMDEGRFDEARREADKALLLSPNSVLASFLKGDLDYLQGNFEAAEKECRAVIERASKSETASAWGRLAACLATRGRFADARVAAAALLALAKELNAANLKAQALYYRGILEWQAGRLDAAAASFEEAVRTFREMDLESRARTPLTARGLLELELGRRGQAIETARELRASVQKAMGRRAVREADLLDGVLALKDGETVKAIALLEQAYSSLLSQSKNGDDARYLGYLAQAYEKSGDSAKARATYEKITGLTAGRFMFGVVYVRAFFKLGELARQRGDTAEATANYRKFLELWKDADPGLPEIAEARRRL